MIKQITKLVLISLFAIVPMNNTQCIENHLNENNTNQECLILYQKVRLPNAEALKHELTELQLEKFMNKTKIIEKLYGEKNQELQKHRETLSILNIINLAINDYQDSFSYPHEAAVIQISLITAVFGDDAQKILNAQNRICE